MPRIDTLPSSYRRSVRTFARSSALYGKVKNKVNPSRLTPKKANDERKLNNDTTKCAVIQAVWAKDCAEAFEKSLLSIFNQNHETLEIKVYLAVDGPIPAQLEAIVARYAKAIHRIIRNPQPLGLGRSLNNLINALGDENFVFRMDSDDISLAGRFVAQVSFMNENPHIDLCGTSIIEINSTGAILGVRHYPESNTIHTLARGTPLAHPSACFRANFFSRFGLYSANALNQDIELWFRASSLGAQIRNVETPYLLFHMNPNFASRRGTNKAFDELSIYIRGLLKIAGPTPLVALPVLRFITRLLPPGMISKLYSSGKLRNGRYAKGDRRQQPRSGYSTEPNFKQPFRSEHAPQPPEPPITK
jgi:hypothetical protein